MPSEPLPLHGLHHFMDNSADPSLCHLPCLGALWRGRTSAWMCCSSQAKRMFLHFSYQGTKMEGGGWGGVRDDGQMRSLIWGYGPYTFPDIEILFVLGSPVQITLVEHDNAADTQGLFPHHTLNTAALQGTEEKLLGFHFPYICLKDQENTVLFQQKLKKENHEKSQPLFSSPSP